MRKLVMFLILVGIASIIPILILFADYYVKLEENSYEFKRTIDYDFYDIRRFDLKYNSYYIAGEVNNDLYLGNYTTRPQFLKISPSLTDTQSLAINIPKTYINKGDSYNLIIDSTKFYVFNGVGRSILQGDVKKWNATPSSIHVPYFQQSVPVSANSVVFQYVSAVTKNNSLRKESKLHKTIENDKVLEKQVDGLFCTTGTLEYNRKLQQLTYLYAYRNQILLMDTNLNLIKKIKTIDPIDSARFEVSAVKSDNSKIITSPSLMVNAQCSSWDKYLFVLSKLMGKNEDGVQFKNSTVIDIYDLEKYKYVSSLYLPNQDKKTVRQFKVINGFIYTMSDHFITRYTVKLPASK